MKRTVFSWKIRRHRRASIFSNSNFQKFTKSISFYLSDAINSTRPCFLAVRDGSGFEEQNSIENKPSPSSVGEQNVPPSSTGTDWTTSRNEHRSTKNKLINRQRHRKRNTSRWSWTKLQNYFLLLPFRFWLDRQLFGGCGRERKA